MLTTKSYKQTKTAFGKITKLSSKKTDDTIKDIRNLFKLEKQINTNKENLFRLEKEINNN